MRLFVCLSVCLFINTLSQKPRCSKDHQSWRRNVPPWVLETHSLWGQRVNGRGHEAQKECRCRVFLHSWECRLLLVSSAVKGLRECEMSWPCLLARAMTSAAVLLITWTTYSGQFVWPAIMIARWVASVSTWLPWQPPQHLFFPPGQAAFAVLASALAVMFTQPIPSIRVHIIQQVKLPGQSSCKARLWETDSCPPDNSPRTFHPLRCSVRVIVRNGD